MGAAGWGSAFRRAWRIGKFAVLAGVVGAVGYFGWLAPVEVARHEVMSGPIIAEVMGTGTLEARVKSTISPKIAGRIAKLLADQGDRVKAGQVLVTLDDADLVQQVEIAKASVASSQAALARFEADRLQAVAVLEQARRNQQRAVRLRAKQALSEEDHEKAVEALGVAQAGMARTEAAILEGRKQLVAAEKTLSYRQALSAETRIVAPFDGLIVKRHRDPGDIVVPGSPVLTLISMDEIWISAWVDETEMARLRVADDARIVFRSEPARSLRGQVVRLGREADRETREFVVDVRVLSLPKNWAVGQRAEVYIETDRKNSATLVPADFLQWRNDKPGVFCQVDDRAEWRDVKLGLRGRDILEVTEGLQPGEVVVMPTQGKNVSLEGRRIVAP
ncbi:MAG: efflux RND transporter periplasmic adaptor subunit [Pirellulales bacterium]